MSFKYINPGYANLLDVSGGVTVVDSTKSKTGVSFYQPTNTQGLNVSEIPNEFYCKFDLFIGNPADGRFEMKILSPDSNRYNGIQIDTDSRDLEVRIFVNGSRVYYRYYAWSNPDTIKQNFNISLNAINTVWFYAKNRTDSSTNDGYFTLYINGKELVKYENQSMYAGTLNPVIVYSNSVNGLISNLIISDTEIDRKEQVVILPISSTETTMTPGENGEYIAGASGQTILQSINTASLINDYGEDSDIKGIAVIGNPTYRTAEGLSELTMLQHDGTTLTEYGTKTAPQDTSGGVVISRYMSMKLPALANYKFGWKAGVY